LFDMPIVDIEVVGTTEAEAARWTQPIADALGAIFGSGHGETWVRMHVLSAGCFAENNDPAPAGREAVFVTVLKRAIPPTAVLEMEAARIAEAVASACGRLRERVHVLYEPPAGGRIAFGGRLVR
jgi:phenylpyruvate tautomerase PptA (4-oxalocrotonate tautomerase family)